MAEDTRHAITLRMEPLLYAALQEAARQQHVSLDQLVERYCAQGLASADATPLDSQTVLALRLLLEEIVERRVEQRMKVQANRLTTLTLRAIRQAAFAHRFLYHSVARTDRARADEIEDQAAQDTSWLLASNIDDEVRRAGAALADAEE